MSAKMELAALLSAAIRNAPESCDFLPVNAVLVDGARQNDKRPAWIRISVPDSWVVNLMKNEKLLDGYVLARVEREFVDTFFEGQTSEERSNEPVENTGSEVDESAGSGDAGEPAGLQE